MQEKNLPQLSDRELLVRIDSRLDSLISSLYGGKTGGGDIPSINHRIESNEARITALEKWRWQITGAIIAAMAMASAIGGIFGSWLSRTIPQ